MDTKSGFNAFFDYTIKELSVRANGEFSNSDRSLHEVLFFF